MGNCFTTPTIKQQQERQEINRQRQEQNNRRIQEQQLDYIGSEKWYQEQLERQHPEREQQQIRSFHDTWRMVPVL